MCRCRKSLKCGGKFKIIDGKLKDFEEHNHEPTWNSFDQFGDIVNGSLCCNDYHYTCNGTILEFDKTVNLWKCVKQNCNATAKSINIDDELIAVDQQNEQHNHGPVDIESSEYVIPTFENFEENQTESTYEPQSENEQGDEPHESIEESQTEYTHSPEHEEDQENLLKGINKLN